MVQKILIVLLMSIICIHSNVFGDSQVKTYSQVNESQQKLVKQYGLDINSYKSLGNNYSSDKNGIYYIFKLISDDIENFKILKEEYAQDTKNIYWYGKIISQDVENFISHAYGFAQDSEHVYFGDQILKSVVGKDFEYIGGKYYGKYHGKIVYLQDKRQLYTREQFKDFQELEILQEADINSFEILDAGYARDTKNIYFQGKRLDFIDASSFQILGEYGAFSRDTHNAYEGAKILERNISSNYSYEDAKNKSQYLKKVSLERNNITILGFIGLGVTFFQALIFFIIAVLFLGAWKKKNLVFKNILISLFGLHTILFFLWFVLLVPFLTWILVYHDIRYKDFIFIFGILYALISGFSVSYFQNKPIGGNLKKFFIESLIFGIIGNGIIVGIVFGIMYILFSNLPTV